MVYLTEEMVKQTISPLDIFRTVVQYMTQYELASEPYAEPSLATLPLDVKGGYVKGLGYGARFHYRGNSPYTTMVWDEEDTFVATVESTYLTYFRTAALLLLFPWVTKMPVDRVLVMGAGKLGSACAAFICLLYPDAELWVWSRTRQTLHPLWPEGGTEERGEVRWWVPSSDQQHFDLILTCTCAQTPLPLDHVSASYIGIGGAVNGARRELPPRLVMAARHIYADDPQRAHTHCGDLQGILLSSIQAVGEGVKNPGRREGTRLSAVCGIGAIDIGVALATAYTWSKRNRAQ